MPSRPSRRLRGNLGCSEKLHVVSLAVVEAPLQRARVLTRRPRDRTSCGARVSVRSSKPGPSLQKQLLCLFSIPLPPPETSTGLPRNDSF